MKELRQPEDVKSDFERLGISVAEWARGKGFSPALVYRVLRGEGKHLRGETHRIAVSLGIKSNDLTGVSAATLALGQVPLDALGTSREGDA